MPEARSQSHLADLAARNQALAAQRHRRTWREQLRRWMLRSFALLPIPKAAQADPNTILLIRPDHLGDVLLTMPAVQALKRTAPHLRLVALTGPWSAEVMAAYPEIDLVLTLPFPGFSRQRDSLLAPYQLAGKQAQRIRQLRAGTALILRPDHWWGALFAALAGIPRRIGYQLPDVSPFLTDRVPYREQHAVLQSLKLVESWTKPIDATQLRLKFPVGEADREYVQQLIAAQPENIALNQRYVVIHPGASTPLKFWPPEHWALVADRLAERLKAAIIFTGSDREHPQIINIRRRMARETTSLSLAGETNIGQLAALCENAALVLGPDTGPLHVAGWHPIRPEGVFRCGCDARRPVPTTIRIRSARSAG